MPARRELLRDERVSSARRTAVLEQLARALADGALALADHDARVIGVVNATCTTDLLTQLHDLPDGYDWDPHPGTVAPAAPASGRAALIVGIASVPLSFCLVGAVFGIVAVVLSLRGGPARPGLSAALLGRIFGIIGVLLSTAALLAVLVTLHRV